MGTVKSKKVEQHNKQLFLELKKAKEDADTGRESALINQIIQNNESLVHFILKKRYYSKSTYSRYNVTYEDLYSDALFALYKAIDTFDVTKNFQFATYAVRVIHNQLSMRERTYKKHYKNNISMETVINEGSREDRNVVLEDVIQDSIDIAEEVVADVFKDKVLKAIKDGLSEKEYKIFTEIVNGKSQREVADEVGLSQSYVSRIYNKARRKAEKIYKIYSER